MIISLFILSLLVSRVRSKSDRSSNYLPFLASNSLLRVRKVLLENYIDYMDSWKKNHTDVNSTEEKQETYL